MTNRHKPFAWKGDIIDTTLDCWQCCVRVYGTSALLFRFAGLTQILNIFFNCHLTKQYEGVHQVSRPKAHSRRVCHNSCAVETSKINSTPRSGLAIKYRGWSFCFVEFKHSKKNVASTICIDTRGMKALSYSTQR